MSSVRKNTLGKQFVFQMLEKNISNFTLPPELVKLQEKTIEIKKAAIHDTSKSLENRYILANFGLAQVDANLFSDPELAIKYLNVLETILKGTDKSYCYNYLALAYAQLYKNSFNKNDLELAEANKDLALNYLANSQIIINSFNTPNADISLLNAIICYITAEIQLVEAEKLERKLYNVDAVVDLYKKSMSYLLNATDVDFNYSLSLLGSRYAYLLTTQDNPKEKAIDVYARLEKNHWHCLSPVELANSLEEYAELLFKQKDYSLSGQKYKMALKILTASKVNSEKVTTLKKMITLIDSKLENTNNTTPLKQINNINKEGFFSIKNFKLLFNGKENVMSINAKNESKGYGSVADDRVELIERGFLNK